ncbi:MAG: WG repeat-containing protein [Rikenellaceae bacterium]|nr:WG repeat-containing protein [Rikenellaceae bacterium]MCL2691811.1 WG repeat-containing protein [Rikenellaceae bacterium]
MPFGLYEWIDASYTAIKSIFAGRYFDLSTKGCARVKQNGKWGIIDRSGKIIVDVKYDKIWTLSSKYLSALHAEIDGKIERINLLNLIRHDIPRCQTPVIDNSHNSINDYHDDDPYGDIQAYNGGFSSDEVESGIADAFEGDYDAYQSWRNN